MSIIRIWRCLPFWSWIVICVYVVMVISVCVWGYVHFWYSGFDLAIYDQVMWNTIHGRWFAYSFNPHSYLVDHREWILLALTPLYALFPHPLTLLVLQTLILACGGIIITILARDRFPHNSKLITLITVLYFAFPPIIGMNLFEFHALPFAIPLTLILYRALKKQQTKIVLAVTLLLLLIRDDVSLMVIGLGIFCFFISSTQTHIARARTFGIFFIVTGISTLIAMSVLGTKLSPDHHIKFLSYYSWLGTTPFDILSTLIHHPLHAFGTILGNDHIIALLLLCAASGFFQFLSPLLLLPAFLPALLLLAIPQPLTFLLIKTHLVSLIIPWIMIAGIEGFYRFIKHTPISQRSWWGVCRAHIPLISIISIIAIDTIFFPLWSIIHTQRAMQNHNLTTYRSIIKNISANDAVMATERFYTHLAHRENLYTSMHLFANTEHYSLRPYQAPDRVDWLLLENEELLRYDIIFSAEAQKDASSRLQSIIDNNELILRLSTSDVIVYGPPISNPPLPTVVPSSSQPFVHVVDKTIQNVRVIGWEHTNNTLRVRATATQPSVNDIHARITWKDVSGKTITSRIIALGGGTFPTHTWPIHKNMDILLSLPSIPNSVSLDILFGSVITNFSPYIPLWVAEPDIDTKNNIEFSISLREPRK